MKGVLDILGSWTNGIVNRFENKKMPLESYVQELYSRPQDDGYDCFEQGLVAATLFRSAKKYNNGSYVREAISRLDGVKEKVSKSGETSLLALDLWMNMEAYHALGDEKYVKRIKEDADIMADELTEPHRFVRAGRKRNCLESYAKDQLLAASALLQTYELSGVEKYKRKAEDILDFFIEQHAAADGVIADKVSLSIDDNGISYHYIADGQAHGLNSLAAITYMNAHRVVGKYKKEAKDFFELSDMSLLVCSESSKSFKAKSYLGKYRELLGRESVKSSLSLESIVGAMHEPVFGVRPGDPGLFREMLSVNFSVALGVGFVGTILPFYMASVAGLGATAYGISTAATCLANVVTLPYAGKLADKFGKKLVLAVGLGTYSLSILLTPWSIMDYKAAGLIASQIARGVSSTTSAPIISSLVTDTVPAGRKTEALSKSQTAYSAGYASGALSSGFVYELIKNGSDMAKVVPFAAAALIPAAMMVRVFTGYQRSRARKKMVESVFNDVQQTQECMFE